MQVWVNTALGETWEDRGGEVIAPEGLAARREAFGDTLPDGVLILTAGVDVQKDRIEAQIIGWGEGEQSWVVDHRVIWAIHPARRSGAISITCCWVSGPLRQMYDLALPPPASIAAACTQRTPMSSAGPG